MQAGELIGRCTTLMIRNLPNKLPPSMIMKWVHELGFKERYYSGLHKKENIEEGGSVGPCTSPLGTFPYTLSIPAGPDS